MIERVNYPESLTQREQIREKMVEHRVEGLLKAAKKTHNNILYISQSRLKTLIEDPSNLKA